MKNTAAVAHFRQLCCLGLGGEVVMPALLKALHDIVPSAMNNFLWADDNGNVCNACYEAPITPELVTLYATEFCNKREREVGPTFGEGMRYVSGVVNWGPLMTRQFLRSDVFNLIWRRHDARDALAAVIRENGKGLGGMLLFRSPGERSFNSREEKALERLIPHIAHALKGNRNLRGAFTASGESGLVIANNRGVILDMCPDGGRLLFMATHPRFDAASLRHDATLPLALTQLCQRLRGIFAEKPDPPPAVWHENAWGKFVFRGYWMTMNAAPDTVRAPIGITIERHEPLALKIARNMRKLPLSTRQQEVCLLLSYGYSHAKIARRLNIGRFTVGDHLKRIYGKLDVHDHNGLLAKLTADLAAPSLPV